MFGRRFLHLDFTRPATRQDDRQDRWWLVKVVVLGLVASLVIGVTVLECAVFAAGLLAAGMGR